MATRTTRPPARSVAPVSPPEPNQNQGVPRSEVATSLAKRVPILAKWLILVLALCSEQARIGIRRAANRYSNLEAMVVSKGIAGAEKIRDKGAKRLTKIVEQFDQVRSDLNNLMAELARLPEQPVTGPKGEVLTATEAEARMATVQAVVTKETDEGSVKHRRVPRMLVRLIPFGAVLDLPVLLYFCAEVFNVDWTSPRQSVIPLLTSAVFAVLGTAAVAIGLHFFGRDLKGYKDHRGHINLPTGQARVVPLTFLFLSIAVAIGSGIVMAFRIISDSLAAGNGGLAGAILGLFFAVIVVALNVVIFSVNYRDGSPQTDELDYHAAQLMPVRVMRRRIQKQIEQATSRLERLQANGIRIYDITLAKMGDPLKGANQLILQARSYHQGCGFEAELVPAEGEPRYGQLLPPVTVDTSVLDNLIKQLQPTEQPPAKETVPTEVKDVAA